MEASAMHFIGDGMGDYYQPNTNDVDGAGLKGNHVSVTTEQIDRILVGLSRNGHSSDANENHRSMTTSSYDQSNRWSSSQGDGLLTRSDKASKDDLAKKVDGSNRNNSSAYRGPRVIFGEKGFIYL